MPANPRASMPFVREIDRIELAVEKQEFAFRIEQVVTVRVLQLLPDRRYFSTALQPIV